MVVLKLLLLLCRLACCSAADFIDVETSSSISHANATSGRPLLSRRAAAQCSAYVVNQGVVHSCKTQGCALDSAITLGGPADQGQCCDLCSQHPGCWTWNTEYYPGTLARGICWIAGQNAVQPKLGKCGQGCATGNLPAPKPKPKPKTAWPTFANRQALNADTGWATYYKAVYGSLPTSYPLNTEDLWILYDDAMANIKNAPTPVGKCPTVNPTTGERYKVNNFYQAPHTSYIWHPYPYFAKAAKTWVEVSRRADPFGDEHFGAWFLYTPGSGMYLDLGKTLSFPNHEAAYKHFSVKGAHPNEDLSKACASQDYDTMQLLQHKDPVNYPCDTKHTGNKALAYMGMEILACKLVGTYACGTKSGAPSVIKAGWQASKACICDNKSKYLNCKGVPSSTLKDAPSLLHI